MTNLTRRRALGLMGATAATTALGSPALASNRKITIGALLLSSHSGSFVAYERGYFADAGLDVQFRFFQAAQPMAVAIAAGDIDYGVTAMTGGLISLADKGAVKIIGGAVSEKQGVYGQKILASDAAFSAGLTSPAALGDKTFGISTPGSSFHYMGSEIAAAEGVDVRFRPLQRVGALIGALQSGQIDAWAIVPHIAKPLAGSGAVHIIGNVADYIPGYQVTTVFTSTGNAENQQALTRDFLAGYSRGVADYDAALVQKSEGQAGVDEMVSLIHKYVYTDRPLEKAATSIINGAMYLNEGAALNIASLQDQLSWFQSEDLVGKDITIDTVVDRSYVKIVNA